MSTREAARVGIRGLVALAAAGLGAACSDDPALSVRDDEICFERRDGRRICVELYEASRPDATSTSVGTTNGIPRSIPGRLPWEEVTWEAARAACVEKGKRLCEADEWEDACDGTVGNDGLTFPYGDERDVTACNVSGVGPVPTGSNERCVSPFGVFDMGGNLWEWTGNTLDAAVARGGGYPSSQTHRCTSGPDFPNRFPPAAPNVEVGFRCCRDVGASE